MSVSKIRLELATINFRLGQYSILGVTVSLTRGDRSAFIKGHCMPWGYLKDHILFGY
jgi:hypothetical protein